MTAPPTRTGATPVSTPTAATATRPLPVPGRSTTDVATAGSALAAPTRSTPQRLRLLSSAVVALGLLVAVVGTVTFAALAYTLDRAEADTAQLIRVQKIQTNLLSADAAATNAFLVGGLEPAAQRLGYDRAMTEASTLVAEAARAQPADTAALAELNREVLAYAAAIEQARANNRQGLPVGAQYLRLASASLRTDALPVLDELVGANARRAAAGMGLGWGVVFPLVTVLALAALVLAQLWVARRFRRRVNPGLAAASLVLLAALVGSGVGLESSARRVSEVRDGDFAAVNAAASARIEAYDAKATESLTLVARGSGSSFEQAWSGSAEAVGQQLDRLRRAELTAEWSAYTEVHRRIRQLDDGGRWEQAVATATGSGAESANARFTRFDERLAQVLDGANTATAAALAGQTPRLVLAALLSLLAGVAAALLGHRGVAARLREYR